MATFAEAPPARPQQTQYTCGASALRSALESLTGERVTEDDLAGELGTSPDLGTDPRAILRVALAHGLDAQLKTGLSVGDLRDWTEAGGLALCGVLVPEGHWITIYAVDGESIHFRDPAVVRGSDRDMPLADFDRSWMIADDDDAYHIRNAVLLRRIRWSAHGRGGKAMYCAWGKYCAECAVGRHHGKTAKRSTSFTERRPTVARKFADDTATQMTDQDRADILGKLTGKELTPDVLSQLPDELLAALTEALDAATNGDTDLGGIRNGAAKGKSFAMYAEQPSETAKVKRFAESKDFSRVLRIAGKTPEEFVNDFRRCQRRRNITAADYIGR